MIPSALDHVVVNVSDISRAGDFYARVLGADIVEFGAGRKAVRIGGQKLNLHDAATKGDPIARDPSVGGADLCILTETPMDDVVRHLEAQSVEIILGPGADRRDGADPVGLPARSRRQPDRDLEHVALTHRRTPCWTGWAPRR